ncbi:DNA primase [Microbacterium phage Cen1621]|uniref:DNA primase n=1 Tax=Microbacterium phage Cen1621 TaxID=2965191 RepID=A0A9E7QDG5_9CAUD|nr:DNA primase [Microbacterium phage Cen1621]
MRTLTDLLDALHGVEETPDGYIATCPAHADSHASLRVTVGDKGNVLVKCRAMCETDEVAKALGLTMRDIARLVPGDDVPQVKRASSAVAASPVAIASLAMRLDGYADALADAEEARPAIAYAQQRFGLDNVDIIRLGLGYVDDIGGGPRLVVPFRTPDGVARNFQARALEQDAAVRWQGPKSPEGGSWSPLGWFPGESGWPEVLICEGPGDALTGAALGYDTLGIAGASRVTNPAIVDEVAQWVGSREAVVAGDGDPAGRRFSSTLAEGLAARGVSVRVLDVPDGLDLTDWRAQEGEHFSRTGIRAIVDAAPVTATGAALSGWDEDRYSLTDLGGARYLRDYIESIGSGVRYTPEAGFLLLDGGVWRVDERQGVRTHAQKVADIVKRIAIEASVEAKSSTDEAVNKRAGRYQRYAAHAQTTRGLDSMLRELQAVEGVPAMLDDFDKHPDLMAARNGVIDLRTGELKPHDPALLLTRRLDFDYVPTAKAPRWEAFLAEIFPSEKRMPEYMRRLIGYGITGHTVDQCFAVLWGTGANGKSVLTDTLTEVFREFTVTTPFSTFEERPSGGIPNDLAALKGARLVMASEGEAGKRMAEAVLKRVTGRDLIAARFMRKEFFEFRPTFLLLLATNNKPQFRGQDEGLWRRVKMLPFERFFKPHERDTRLGSKLLEEREGIVAWAVRGAQEWYAQGLGDPESVKAATDNYRDESDVLYGFLPGEWVADPTMRVDATSLFRSFQEYADENNYRELKGWSSRAFYGALGERGFPKRKTGGKWVIDGIRRARAVDRIAEAELDADAPAEKSDEKRAEVGSQAASPSVTNITGVDLDAIF